MGRRSYSSVSGSSTSSAQANVSQKQAAPVQASKSEKSFGKGSAVLIALALIMSAAAAVIAVTYNIKDWFDENNGAASADEAAASFVSAIDDSDDNLMYKYVPRDIRNSGFMADTMNISELKKLDEEHDISLSNIVIDSISDLTDKIKALESGLYSVYNKAVNISGARRVHVTADMSYDLEDHDYATQVTFDLICIKVRAKWYVYTGQQLSEDLDSDDSDAVHILQADDRADVPYDIISTYIKPVVKEIKPLSFYSSAKDDLISGKISIDNVEYVMPVSYQSMMNLYSLADDMFTEDTRKIKQNYILKHIPIVFNEAKYSMTGFDVSIGNTSDKEIDISEGIVTTLYIGRPDNIYDYPDVYLPGNVTLGTSYDDIVKMYGRLDAYGGNDNVIKHAECAIIYQLELNNKRNCVYFEFNYDNELVAIQYYYFDLNSFFEE